MRQIDCYLEIQHKHGTTNPSSFDSGIAKNYTIRRPPYKNFPELTLATLLTGLNIIQGGIIGKRRGRNTDIILVTNRAVVSSKVAILSYITTSS